MTASTRSGSLPAEPAPGGTRPPRAARSTRVSSAVVTLGIVSLLTDISSESVAAILPLYITAALGLSTIAYGFIDGILQGASALVRIAGGWAADRGDHPKWVAFVGYGLSAVSRAGLLLASGFAGVAAMITVDRLGKGIRTAPRDAMITAASEPRTLARSFGVHRTLDTVGATLGPLIAFAILLVIPNGYHTVFVVSLGFAVVGLAVLGLFAPDLRPRRAAWLEKHRTRETRGLPSCKGCSCGVPGLVPAGRPFSWRSAANPAVRKVLLAVGGLALLTVGDGFVYLSLQARDGFATQWFPLLYVGTNLAYMSLALPIGRLADRWGRARVLIVGHVALLAAYLSAAVVLGGAWTTLVTLALLGVFYAATDGVLAAVVGEHADASVRGTAIGTAQTVVAVARMVSAAGFGFLWYGLGRAPAMLVVAGALAIALPFAYRAVRGLDTAPPPDDQGEEDETAVPSDAGADGAPRSPEDRS
ncbi:MFS transporter [Actinotalea sp.]|uniref:MFS transporter n=1 Tax=Actinotalea sp. TaxID=1872145 RepID=UPI003562EBDD